MIESLVLMRSEVVLLGDGLRALTSDALTSSKNKQITTALTERLDALIITEKRSQMFALSITPNEARLLMRAFAAALALNKYAVSPSSAIDLIARMQNVQEQGGSMKAIAAPAITSGPITVTISLVFDGISTGAH